MPRPKKNNNEKISPEFTSQILPDEKELEIEESLSEIYHDQNGQLVDVKKIERKKRSWLFYFFSFFLAFTLLSSLFYVGYNYYLGRLPASVLNLSLEAPAAVRAGEEFFYLISYKNNGHVGIRNGNLKINYPENFVFIDSSPSSPDRHDQWPLNGIPAGGEGEIKIKGKLIGKKGEENQASITFNYTPENFSSEFIKEASALTIIESVGWEIGLNVPGTIFVGTADKIGLTFRPEEKNYLNSFRLTIDHPEEMQFIKDKETVVPDKVMKNVRPGVWDIDFTAAASEKNASSSEREISIPFLFKSKGAEKQNITIRFEALAGENFRKFQEDTFPLEILKNDFNLVLFINGGRENKAVSPGETLNYSIFYSNKGENALTDAVIMAAIEGEGLDWGSLEDKTGGQVSGRTISWSKEEKAELAEIKKNDEGSIDFSLKVLDSANLKKISGSGEIKSYVQFSLAGKEAEGNEDNKSNTIINKINSDLTFKEEVRYFDENNIAVGNGPLPPKVGEKTSFKVYWKISDNWHELYQVKAVAKLPEYVSWDNKSESSAGAISYDENRREVSWEIGRLPRSAYEASASFNLSLIPEEKHLNKILVILPGTTITAEDRETEGQISKTAPAKTTKLEDDEVAKAENDGIVRGN